MERPEKTPLAKTKTKLRVLLFVVLALAFCARFISIGWIFIIFGLVVVILPLGLHLFVHLWIIKKIPSKSATPWYLILDSHLALIIFMIAQGDFGDIGGAYTFYTRVGELFGVNKEVLDQFSKFASTYWLETLIVTSALLLSSYIVLIWKGKKFKKVS